MRKLFVKGKARLFLSFSFVFSEGLDILDVRSIFAIFDMEPVKFD